MPDRIIKESVATSDSLSRLSLLASMFWGIFLTAFDDHGCFDARTAILKSRLFPLRTDVTEAMIEGWISEFAEVEMIRLWTEENGVRFGQCLSFDFHNDIVAKRSPTTPCPPWLRQNGTDPRLGTETLQAFQRIDVAVAKLSSGGQEPTYRQIIAVAGCSASTLAKYRKHKAAIACYTTLPGATPCYGRYTQNPKGNPKGKENQKEKEKRTTPPDSRRVPLRDFMFKELRNVGIEPVTDKSDWEQFEVLLAKTRDTETAVPKEPFTIERLREYFTRFVHSPNAYDRDQGHPIRFFCTNVNKFMRDNGNGSNFNGGGKTEIPGSTSNRTTKTGSPKYNPRQ